MKLKHIKPFLEAVNKSSDFNIYKIRYYADGINFKKNKPDVYDEKQHWERAQEYNKFLWQLIEKVTKKSMKKWTEEYFLSSRDCAIEELYDKYDVIIPEGEIFSYWYIPKSMVDICEWIEGNCKLPFKKLIKAPMGNIRNRQKTTWRRDTAKKSLPDILKNK